MGLSVTSVVGYRIIAIDYCGGPEMVLYCLQSLHSTQIITKRADEIIRDKQLFRLLNPMAKEIIKMAIGWKSCNE